MDIDRPGDGSALPPPPGAQPGETWSLDPAGGPIGDPSPETTQARRRGRRRTVVAMLVAVALVAGGTAAAGFFGMRGSNEELFGKIPDDADVVVAVYLDPSAGQKANLFRMAAKFPGLQGQTGPQNQLNDAMDAALESLGLGHEDVGWVGVEVALFVDLRDGQTPSVGVLVDSDDDAGARDALRRVQERGSTDGTTWRTTEHDGVTITAPTDASMGTPAFALFDGTVVVGSTEDAVAGVIDTAHGTHGAIEDAPTFADTLARLPKGKLALIYANVQPILQMAQGSFGAAGVVGAPNLLTGDIGAIRSAGMTISAEPDGLALDSVTLYDDSKLSPESRDALSAPDHANALLAMVPADAYAVAAAEHVDRSLAESLDQLEGSDPRLAKVVEQAGVSGPDGLIAHMTGDVAVETAPDGSASLPAGALMVGMDDATAATRALDKLFASLPLGRTSYDFTPQGDVREHHEAVVWKTETYHGTAITFAASGADQDVAYGVVGDAAVVATSRRHFEHLVDLAGGDPGLEDDAGYRAAIEGVPSSDAVLYVDVARILAAVRAQLDPVSRGQFDDQVGANLDPVHAVVLGAEGDATGQRTRLLVRIP
jgi:Protein of unknown function (DUF3352)